jgi:hypothetical protein
MNLKTVALSFLVGAATATMLGSMAPKAEASTCDLGNFNARCAHSKGADLARTYAEAKRFADGNIVEVCFNGNYTSQYYSNTCKMLGRGY